MRLLIGTVAVAATLAALPAQAQIAYAGSAADSGCTGPVDNRAVSGELYGVKLNGTAAGHLDWMFDMQAKGGMAVGGTDAGGLAYNIPPNWAAPQGGTDVVFIYITYPGGILAVDSGQVASSGGATGVVIQQKVGDSLASGVNAGRGLVLPGTASQYNLGDNVIVDAHQAPGTRANFPYGTRAGIEVAFAPVAELNSTAVNGFCTVGGADADPGAAGRGAIAGYNVWRVVDTGSVPTPAQFAASMANYQYFLPLGTINMTTGDTAGMAGPDINGDTIPDGDGMDAGADGAADSDLLGMQNPDSQSYTGDEVVIFQDSGSNPDGSARTRGAGPAMGSNYWYAFQPVVGTSRVSDYMARTFSSAGSFSGNHTLDLDMDGTADSVDLDLDGTPEFISPNAAGMGLTNNSLPLLSAPVRGTMNPAPAMGRIAVTAVSEGSSVNVTFSSGLEGGNVLGFNVFRVAGETRTKVNDALIAARGGEGNVYSVADVVPAAGASRRVSRGASYQYLVETVFNDGTASSFAGPFDVTSPQATGRRSR